MQIQIPAQSKHQEVPAIMTRPLLFLTSGFCKKKKKKKKNIHIRDKKQNSSGMLLHPSWAQQWPLNHLWEIPEVIRILHKSRCPGPWPLQLSGRITAEADMDCWGWKGNEAQQWAPSEPHNLKSPGRQPAMARIQSWWLILRARESLSQ